MKAATVAFCDNPFGGIGCSRKSTQSIYLSGGKLNGVPDVLAEPDEMLTSSPELLAVLAHELGHLYGDVHAHQQVVSSIDHPKVENAYLILLEFQADAAGLYNLFHQTKYSFGEVLAFAALAAGSLLVSAPAAGTGAVAPADDMAAAAPAAVSVVEPKWVVASDVLIGTCGALGYCGS